MIIRNKKAALEMSMTTIIMIVLSVVFLILALIVLRNMYGFQTESIGSVQEQTLKQINDLYLGGEDSTSGIRVEVGSDNTAKIRAGNPNFGIGIAANTLNNAPIQKPADMQFEISLDSDSNECARLNSEAFVKKWFLTPLDKKINAKDIYLGAGGLVIILNIPATTKICTQGVLVRAYDFTANPEGDLIAQKSFNIQILRKAPLG